MQTLGVKHFLDLSDCTAQEIRGLIAQAKALKAARKQSLNTTLAGKTLAMIFEKNSTRTRVSFEVAMLELGGRAIFLSGNDLQLGRGETVADTARVLSRYVDGIMLRCHSHEKLLELARHASVPVINGLTEFSHPCQILADVMTAEESLGELAGKKVAWVGDGNNVAQSWIQAAALLGFSLHLACPAQLRPLPEVLAWARERGGDITLSESPDEAIAGADVVTTDTWVSMGDPEAEKQMALLRGYQVSSARMALAKPSAIFLHCLPAHRGEEVTAEVIDGPSSRVWDEAENRLHVQKAILLWCLGALPAA
jgi:ornithine carbamoyltransferase